ncbi:MAG: alkaline phosphatase family protein [Chloroflexi bacterium]|nr:alkaline phosphatase family protein [Chloroflexota bacterium]
MTDLARLMHALATGTLKIPDEATPSIVDLANALASLIGAAPARLSSNAERIRGLIGSPDHIVLVVVDGLGMNLLERMPGDSFFREHLASELLTVFPSTTPAALTSLATGLWPSQHAIVGWHTYLPALRDVSTIIRFERRSDEAGLGDLGVSTEAAYPEPSLLGRTAWDGLYLLPHSIWDTPYSTYYAGDMRRAGYEKASVVVKDISERVNGAEDHTFTALYISFVDSTAHELGADHARTRARAMEADSLVWDLAERLPDDARLVMTADHGLLDCRKHLIYRMDPSDELIKCLRHPPSGDRRVMYFDVRRDRVGRFTELFGDAAGDAFALITVEEAAEIELLGPGPMSIETRARIGSHVALSLGEAAFYYPEGDRDGKAAAMVSHHSGLTPDEMRIPLVIFGSSISSSD